MTTSHPPPSAPLTLAALRERARSLDATMQDIDALLVAMSRPVWPGERVRPRADVLHLIIDDLVMGGLRGSDGRRVDETAARALEALGESYVRELSADGRKILQNAPPLPTPEDTSEERTGITLGSWQFGLGAFLVVCGLIEMSVTRSWLAKDGWSKLFVFCGPMSFLTTTLPGLMLMKHVEARIRWLYVGVMRFLVRPAIAVMMAIVMVTASISCLSGGRDKTIEPFLLSMLTGVAVRVLALQCLRKVLDDAPPAPPSSGSAT